MAIENDLLQRIESLEVRFQEITSLITAPDIIADQKRFMKLSKEYRDLERILDKGKEYRNSEVSGIVKKLNEFKELLNEQRPEHLCLRRILPLSRKNTVLTERAANNHCNFDQDIPSVENAHAPPTATKI